MHAIASQPRERPILFSGEMVRAILAGRKTQTRRVVKDTGLYAIDDATHGAETASRERAALATRFPYGVPGDTLWVRETWGILDGGVIRDAAGGVVDSFETEVIYRADASPYSTRRWRPSIHMPRWASRITLRITEVRVERLQSISEDDAIAEGIDGPLCAELTTKSPWKGELAPVSVHAYAGLWESLNGAGSWAANPFVWVVGLERVGT